MGIQVGVDLGTRAIKVVAGRMKGPQFAVHRAFRIPVEMTGEPEEAILQATGQLGTLLGKAPGARLGLSGRELIIRYTQVPPVPLWRLDLLMDFEVREMSHQAGEPLASDYNLVTLPGKAAEGDTVLVAVVKERFLKERFQTVSEACGRARSAMPCSLALFNAYLHCGALHEGEYVFLVDIGDRNTEMVLQKDGELLFARNISAGSGMLTEAVAQTFGVSAEQAEPIKEQFGRVALKGMATFTSGKEERVANALIGPAGQLASMLQSSLAFSRAQTGIRDLKVGRLLLSGGGANLRGFPEYLAASLQCPVERFQPESGLDLSSLDPEEDAAFNADPGRFAVALGLAVAGEKEDAFLVDLVPQDVRRQQNFLRRTLFLYASAAAAVLFLVLRFFALSGVESDLAQKGRTATLRAQQARRDRDVYETERRRMEEAEQRLAALAAETESAFALATAQALIQATCPEGVWIEQLEVKREAVPLDENDRRKGTEVKTLVTAEGEIVSVDIQAESALQQMVVDIQKARPGTGVKITSQSAGAAVGSKKLGFKITIDCFQDVGSSGEPGG